MPLSEMIGRPWVKKIWVISRWRRGLICGALSSPCYGTLLFLIHALAESVSSQEIAGIRAFTTILLLLPIVARHKGTLFGKKALTLWVFSIVAAISVFCFTWNLQHTTVGLANTLFNIAPFCILMLGVMSRRERIEWRSSGSVVLVVLASILFWHGSRTEAGWLVWSVGLGGMCAASIAYIMLKTLPARWSALDKSWAASVAVIPVVWCFNQSPWVIPSRDACWKLVGLCILGVIANVLENMSFQYLDLATATAFIPSSIIWGVLLDMKHHNFPPWQGFGGCLLYLVAIVTLIGYRPQSDEMKELRVPAPQCTDSPQMASSHLEQGA
jgi:drug/metabolite transporter (DMT)-like permease